MNVLKQPKYVLDETTARLARAVVRALLATHSLTTLSQKTGVSRSSLSEYRGGTRNPSKSNWTAIKKYADSVGVDTENGAIYE